VYENSGAIARGKRRISHGFGTKTGELMQKARHGGLIALDGCAIQQRNYSEYPIS
jgi:hypothetical protein